MIGLDGFIFVLFLMGFFQTASFHNPYTLNTIASVSFQLCCDPFCFLRIYFVSFCFKLPVVLTLGGVLKSCKMCLRAERELMGKDQGSDPITK